MLKDIVNYGAIQMGLSLKTFKDLFNLVVGKFNKELPEVDPTIEASLGRAISGASAISALGVQEGITDAVEQMYWQTADDEYLELIGEYDKTTKYEAQKSTGFGAVGGTLGTLVPSDTPLTAIGKNYIVTQDAYVITYNGNVSLSESAGIVTAITSSVHSLSTGLEVTIADATQTEYNGTFEITVLDENTFTYEVEVSPATTDNGTFSSNYALLDIESVDTGDDVNIDAGGTMTINIVDIDDTVYVGVDGITGGLEIEDQEDYRTRVGESHIITPSVATNSMIKYSCKKIVGNTRVYIVNPQVTDDGYVITGGIRGTAGYLPNLGEVVIYILRDNDTSIIPSAIKLAETKQQIIDDGNWTSCNSMDNIFVLAPIVTEVNFVFTSITPNTITMQNAIKEQLSIFFIDNADVNGETKLNSIESFLDQIQDATGEFLVDYTLTTPSADLSASSGELFIRGTVTFS
jgi:uncharacterized phage protein gp47/JayE